MPGQRWPRRDHRRGSPRVGVAVTRFVVAGNVALLVLALAGTAAMQRLGTKEAIRDARVLAELYARTVVQPALTAQLAAGDPAALQTFDGLVRARVLREPVVRLKLWTPDGRILYADDARLLGARYQLGTEASAVLRRGGTAADLSDLSAPENRFEAPQHQLLEVYQKLRAPDGSPVLFELYLRFSSVTASGGRIWRSFAPAFLWALLLLELLQVPLAWSLARQLRRRQHEREELLTRALHASDVERQRIARDLHDGVVQTLSGVAYTLAGMQSRLVLPEQREAQLVLTGAVSDTRRGISELRSLLVEIYPPSLARAGLARALSDLATALTSRDVVVHVHVDPALVLPGTTEALIYRVAQEAVRNIVRHAQATNASVTVTATATGSQLSVVDDGLGFDDALPRATADAHFGLVMAGEFAAELGGELLVTSRPGHGTTLVLELP